MQNYMGALPFSSLFLLDTSGDKLVVLFGIIILPEPIKHIFMDNKNQNQGSSMDQNQRTGEQGMDSTQRGGSDQHQHAEHHKEQEHHQHPEHHDEKEHHKGAGGM